MDIEKAKIVVRKLKDVNNRNSIGKAIETVLSELEKKDKKIEKLKKDNKELLRKLRNRVKEVNKLTKYSLYKKEFSTLNKQLEKKEAIINEMAEYITYCFNEDEGICKKSASEMNYQSYNCDNNCNKCIKQHFTNKVEKEGIKE